MKLTLPKLNRSPKKHRPAPVKADIVLLVHGAALLHVEQPNLVAQHDESLLAPSAAELAAAARRLLPNTDRQTRIALALPNSEFIATHLNLPAGIGEQNLRSAVSLQQPTLLPGLNGPLLLAVQPPTESDAPTIVLWLPVARAEELFQAFAKENLFLTAVLPRALLAVSTEQPSCQVWDEDEQGITYFEWSQHTIKRWLQFSKTDYEIPEFKTQLDEALRDGNEAQNARVWKAGQGDWDTIPMPSGDVYHYAFAPPSALMHMAQQKRIKQRRQMSIAAGVLVAGVLAGIAGAVFYQNQLEQQLSELKSNTRSVSDLQASVVAMEDDVAPVVNFPKPSLPEILGKLNTSIPKDSWITAFRIDAGVIELEGYSPNPSKLLETLSNEPMFTGVTFNQQIRTESGRTENRFGIRLVLPAVDIATYWQTYFPMEE